MSQRENIPTTAEVNRDVLGKSGQIIDFKEALKYPLSPIPLSLSFPDGTKRSTAKSSLMKVINYTQLVEDDAYVNIGAYIIDLMATIRVVGSFSTVEELISRVLSTISRDCGRVDLVADSYREISWKNTTRAARGEGSSTILKLAKMKIRDTNVFLHENKNKSQLIEIFFKWLIDNRRKVLNTLKTTNLYLSAEGSCQRLSISDVSSIENLISTHEEADFRLMAHVKHALTHSNSPVIVRSHSGDTDIFIMAVTSFHSTNLILDSGTWCRKEDSADVGC